MSRAARILLMTVTLASLTARAADPGKATPATKPPRSTTLLDGVPATPGPVPFGDGETLKFTASYGVFSVGEATMQVDLDGTFDGKPAIHLTSGSATGRTFSKMFYAFSGTGESWIDPTGLYSVGFVTDQSQRGMQDVQEWEFDYERGVAMRDREKRLVGGATRSSEKEYTLAKTHVQDSMSMIYFIRAFPLKVGSKLESNVFESKKVWTLTVNVVGREKIKTKAGTFDALKVKPEVSTLEGKKQNKGQMVVWLTDDERKMPIRIDAATGYGNVTAELVSFNEGVKTAKQ